MYLKGNNEGLLEILNLSTQEIILKRKEIIINEGDRNDNIYYVVEGSLRIFISNGDEEQIIRFGYENNFIVALDTLLTGNATQYFVQAIKKCRLKVIPYQSLQKFIKQDNNILIWNNILEELIIQLMEREKDLLTESPHERFSRVMNRSPQLLQEIPMKYIANYLRMSPETLSRMKKY